MTKPITQHTSFDVCVCGHSRSIHWNYTHVGGRDQPCKLCNALDCLGYMKADSMEAKDLKIQELQKQIANMCLEILKLGSGDNPNKEPRMICTLFGKPFRYWYDLYLKEEYSG